MKRFFLIKDAGVPILISDGQGMVYAEFTESNGGDNVFLLDKKNDKIQYKIIRKGEDIGTTYSLFQEDLFVGTTSPLVGSGQHTFSIAVPKYGNNLEVSFRNKTDFEVSRDGIPFALFAMSSDNRGNLDIAKGERRNFSFAIAALFVFWSFRNERLLNENKENEKKEIEKVVEKAVEKVPDENTDPTSSVRRKKSRSRSSEKNSKELRSTDKSKSEKPRAVEKSRSITDKTREISKLNIPKRTLTRESECSEDFLNAEESSGNEGDDDKRKPVRRRSSRTPRGPISARTSIPLRSSSIKSPRNALTPIQTNSARKTESSNSVLNALLQRKREMTVV